MFLLACVSKLIILSRMIFLHCLINESRGKLARDVQYFARQVYCVIICYVFLNLALDFENRVRSFVEVAFMFSAGFILINTVSPWMHYAKSIFLN